jgi:hypothetical protein
MLLAATARAAHAQDMPGMDHSAHMEMPMDGPLGLGHGREASGTAWQPDSTPTRAAMWHKGSWMLMLHGQLFAQYIDTTGDRGDRQFGSSNWIMAMARRDLAGGQITGRAMLSGDRATLGICGYPDIGQSVSKCGERLRDLQHPHDFFMEIGADYRRALNDRVAIQVYGGPAGEPALGPAAFPHRLSSLPNPLSPITHHSLDASHISFGVVTGGAYGRRWKAEASAFNGRHSDTERYGFDLAPMNSYSGRVWWLPSAAWSIQVSSGWLRAPEAHNHTPGATDITMNRTTASATYHRVSDGRVWATTVAWGQNREKGVTTTGALGETAFDVTDRDTLFGRAEILDRTSVDVNFSTLELQTFGTAKVQAGYQRIIGRFGGFEGSVGGAAAVAIVPETLNLVYGGRTAAEFSVFVSIRPPKQ